MPYKIVKTRQGWRVRSFKKIKGKFKYFSKKPMTLDNVKKQFRLLTAYDQKKKLKTQKRIKKTRNNKW